MIMSAKQKKLKFKPRIKLNNNKYESLTYTSVLWTATRLFFEDRCVLQINGIFFINNQVKVAIKKLTIFLNFPLLGFLSKCEC